MSLHKPYKDRACKQIPYAKKNREEFFGPNAMRNGQVVKSKDIRIFGRTYNEFTHILVVEMVITNKTRSIF